MKKVYMLTGTAALLLCAYSGFAQSERKAEPANVQIPICKTCASQPKVLTIDTTCNFNTTDTLTIYYADLAPHDSGWAYGHNAYGDMGWAERYVVAGNASVLGGAYRLYQTHGASASTTAAMGKVYSISATTGKPATALGTTANIPFNTMVLNGNNYTFFVFSAPIAVTDSFFMAYEYNAYTLGGPDTICIVSSKSGNRTTTNVNQNCAKWSDGLWYYELTQNFGGKLNLGLCTIVSIPIGVENYVSKGDLKLYAAYPSPASAEVTFNYYLANSNKTSIEIFDTQGKSMMKIDKGNQSSGMHYEKVDVSSLSAGIYFYNVVTENGILFSKFTVVK